MKYRLNEVVERAQRLATTLATSQKMADGTEFRLATEKLATARELLAELNACTEVFDILIREWSDVVDRQRLELKADLERACAACGWRIDGHWPDLFVERAISVKFDKSERSATVGSRTLKHVDVKSLVAMLKPMIQELIPKKFSAQDFIQSLCDAYDEIRGTSSQVSVLRAYRAFVVRLQKPRFWRDARQDAFTGLSLDQFRARLSNALEAGCFRSRDSRELRLIAPIDPADAIYLYQPAERRFGHVGRIEFVMRRQDSEGPK